MRKTSLLAVLVMAAIGTVAQANLLTNGGFEAETFDFPGYKGSGTITGWTGGSGVNPALTGGSPFADELIIPDGSRTAFIQNSGTLSQTVTLSSGTYELSWYEAHRIRSSDRPYVTVAVTDSAENKIVSSSYNVPQCWSTAHNDGHYKTRNMTFDITTAGTYTISYIVDSTLSAVNAYCGVLVNDVTYLLDGVVLEQTGLILTTVESRSGRIDTTSNGALDYVMHNGRVHVDGEVYTHIILSGTVTNWTGETKSDWTGTWGFISLLGSDYFIGRNVPTVVDETMNVFTYVGDTNYGDPGKQRGYAQNAGMSFWKNGYWSSLGQIDNAFAIQDCDFEVGGSSHKDDLPWNPLTDSTRFVYEIEYDLSAMSATLRVKDVGDGFWDQESTVQIGLRDVTGNDDWSDVVTSVHVANTLINDTTTYGFDYAVKMAIENVVSGDANLDGIVDVGDLGILAANYGGTGKGWNQGDFTGDGVVDVGDLGVLAANYGTNASGADFDVDYAKVFGSCDSENEEETGGMLCNTLGLPMIVGLAMLGLMLIRLDD